MRKLGMLLVAATLAVFALVSVPPTQADACTCPWQVRQLTTTNSSCALALQNAQQNAGAWASFSCPGSYPNVCTYLYTSLGCTVDSSGTATEVGLINFKCTTCP